MKVEREWNANGTQTERKRNANGTQIESIYERVPDAFSVRLFLCSTVCSQVRANEIRKYLLFCVSDVYLSSEFSGYFVFVRVRKYVVVSVVLSNRSSLIKLY